MDFRLVRSATLLLGIGLLSACGGDGHPTPANEVIDEDDDAQDEDRSQEHDEKDSNDAGLHELEPEVPPFEQALSELKRVTSPEVSAASIDTFSRDNRAFAIDMYRKLKSKPGNLFFSPYSISSALAMTYAGARGETASEMQTALHFSLPAEELHRSFNKLDLALASRGTTSASEDKTFELAVRNAVWAQKDFLVQPAYLDTLAVNYGAGVNLLDFATEPELSRMTINAWVAKQTHDRIRDLLPEMSIKPLTRVVLTNTAYFKARWARVFSKEATRDETFHGFEGDLSLPMMKTTLNTKYAKGAGWEAALLPYSEPQLAMLLIVPEHGKFGTFEASFDAATLDSVIAELSEEYQLELTLPRFKFAAKFNLREQLVELGMSQAFDDDADLSGIDAKGELKVSEVFHQAFVAVDEEGTEAAAATAVVIAGTTSIPNEPQPASLRVDRPFLFAVYDRPTGAVLFLGRFSAPAP